MELKKSVKADLEWKKPTFFQVGLVLSLLIVFIIFERVGAREKDEDTFYNAGIQLDEDEKIIQTDQQKDIPPPPPEQMSQTLLEIVANDADVGDFTIDAESDEHLEVEEIVYVENTKEPEVHEVEIFEIVEVQPEFPGGDAARQRFLQENVKYPKVAMETGTEGTVMVSFVVEPDGRITNVEIARSRAPSLDEEAIRVTKSMPKWKPGQQRGRAVRTRFRMPISFVLN